MTSPELMLEMLYCAHDESINLIGDAHYDKRNFQHTIILSLYGSILELTGSILVLVREKIFTGLAPLLRTIYEAYLDLQHPRKGC
jgi:hypothetical protein